MDRKYSFNWDSKETKDGYASDRYSRSGSSCSSTSFHRVGSTPKSHAINVPYLSHHTSSPPAHPTPPPAPRIYTPRRHSSNYNSPQIPPSFTQHSPHHEFFQNSSLFPYISPRLHNGQYYPSHVPVGAERFYEEDEDTDGMEEEIQEYVEGNGENMEEEESEDFKGIRRRFQEAAVGIQEDGFCYTEDEIFNPFEDGATEKGFQDATVKKVVQPPEEEENAAFLRYYGAVARCERVRKELSNLHNMDKYMVHSSLYFQPPHVITVTIPNFINSRPLKYWFKVPANYPEEVPVVHLSFIDCSDVILNSCHSRKFYGAKWLSEKWKSIQTKDYLIAEFLEIMSNPKGRLGKFLISHCDREKKLFEQKQRQELMTSAPNSDIIILEESSSSEEKENNEHSSKSNITNTSNDNTDEVTTDTQTDGHTDEVEDQPFLLALTFKINEELESNLRMPVLTADVGELITQQNTEIGPNLQQFQQQFCTTIHHYRSSLFQPVAISDLSLLNFHNIDLSAAFCAFLSNAPEVYKREFAQCGLEILRAMADTNIHCALAAIAEISDYVQLEIWKPLLTELLDVSSVFIDPNRVSVLQKLTKDENIRFLVLNYASMLVSHMGYNAIFYLCPDILKILVQWVQPSPEFFATHCNLSELISFCIALFSIPDSFSGQHVHLVIAKKYAMKILLYLNKHLYSREDTLHIIQALINVCFESDNDLKISALTLMQILLEQGEFNEKMQLIQGGLLTVSLYALECMPVSSPALITRSMQLAVPNSVTIEKLIRKIVSHWKKEFVLSHADCSLIGRLLAIEEPNKKIISLLSDIIVELAKYEQCRFSMRKTIFKPLLSIFVKVNSTELFEAVKALDPTATEETRETVLKEPKALTTLSRQAQVNECILLQYKVNTENFDKRPILGEGTDKVYAYSEDLRTLAVKLSYPHNAKYINEITSLSFVSHPNIIKCYGAYPYSTIRDS